MKPKKILAGKLILAMVPVLLPAGASHACEGADLEQTNQMYQHMEFVSRTCNESGSVADSMQCLEEEWGYMSGKMSKLPPSCREMLKEFDPQVE